MKRYWLIPYAPGLNASAPKRDATAGELRDEPEIVLRELAAGRMGASATTAALAQAELSYRRLRVRA